MHIIVRVGLTHRHTRNIPIALSFLPRQQHKWSHPPPFLSLPSPLLATPPLQLLPRSSSKSRSLHGAVPRWWRALTHPGPMSLFA